MSACLPQIRNSGEIQEDTYFRYFRSDLKDLSPAEVLQAIGTPENEEEWNDTAVAYARTLRLDLAEEHFDRALGNAALPYLNAAWLYGLCEEEEGMRSMYRKLARNEKISTEILRREAAEPALNSPRGNMLPGEILLLEMAEAGRESEKIYELLAENALGRGEDRRAMELFYRTLEVNPKNASALFFLGKIFYRENDYERVAYYLKTAIAFVDDDSPLEDRLYFHLIDSLYRLERFGEARKYLEFSQKAGFPRSLELIELHGQTLLTLDPRADLAFLLEERESLEDRIRMQEAWYGTADPDLITRFRFEFELQY